MEFIDIDDSIASVVKGKALFPDSHHVILDDCDGRTFHHSDNFPSDGKTKAKPRRNKVLSGPERLEDVFQDYVVREFLKIDQFKRFARSRHGLGLREYDIEMISHDYMHSGEEQKMQMLMMWKQKHGKAATSEKIRDIVENYRKENN